MGPPFPIRAVMLSLLGAAIGSMLWVLTAIAADLERAVPALLVGAFAGAAPRLETQRGRVVQLAAFAFTLLGLIVVQYFVVRHAVVTELVATGRDRSIPMFLSPGSAIFVTFGWLRVYPLDALVWALSAGMSLALPIGTEGQPQS